MTFTVASEYGYVLATAIGMYLVQNVVIVGLCVMPARMKSKITVR